MTRPTGLWRRLLLATVAAMMALPFSAGAAAATGGSIQNTAELWIIQIRCWNQNDSFGSDEPYITVNGQRVWNENNVDEGDVAWVGQEYQFTGTIEIQLWEDDGGLTGGDDHLGTYIVYDHYRFTEHWPLGAFDGYNMMLSVYGL